MYFDQYTPSIHSLCPVIDTSKTLNNSMSFLPHLYLHVQYLLNNISIQNTYVHLLHLLIILLQNRTSTLSYIYLINLFPKLSLSLHNNMYHVKLFGARWHYKLKGGSRSHEASEKQNKIVLKLQPNPRNSVDLRGKE